MGPGKIIDSKYHKFLISVDAINPIDNTLYAAIGKEYKNNDMLVRHARLWAETLSK